MRIEHTQIAGSGVRSFPCSALLHSETASHAGIIFPGLRHTVDRPDLHYAQRILYENGADVFRLEYEYWRPEYAELSDAEQDACLAADAREAFDFVLSRPYMTLSLVGKSLGTVAMSHLLDDERCREASCVWETPLLGVAGLTDRIQRHRPRSLFVVGTADAHYDESVLSGLERVMAVRALRVAGADHSLEVPGDLEASLEALRSVVLAVESFVADGSSHQIGTARMDASRRDGPATSALDPETLCRNVQPPGREG
jgi:hypothetical protein